MHLHTLTVPQGATKKRKRRGRGESSGLGKTAGRGGKGQTARSGKGKPGRGFEGGQMPMYRRMPKRGFVKVARERVAVVNLDALVAVFGAGAVVDLDAVKAVGLARSNAKSLRVLARGDCTHSLVIRAAHVSGQAKEKLEAAGGRVETAVRQEA